jgi:Xaa-Pro aminopeptidase
MIDQSAPFALFTRGEMERRYARARELMDARGIDALLVSGEENFQYFAGTSASIGLHYSLTRPSVFILPLTGDSIILTQGHDAIALSCYVTNIRPYTGLLRFPHEELVRVLEEAGLSKDRVGAELGQEQRMGIPVGAYLDLVRALPRVEFVDAADILIQLRMVKSAEEIAYIRKAAEITARARQRLYDAEIIPGMTERQAVRALRRLILEEGGDRMSFCHIQNGLPGYSNQFHYDRPLERGMMIGMDAGAYYGMYTIDYPRFAVLGQASKEQRRVHDAARSVSRTMAEAVRPGVTCAELHRIALIACDEAGVEPDHAHKQPGSRMGHGQGVLLTEPPSITPEDQTVLAPGMVLSTEPGVTGLDGVSVLWEDVHLVTEDGRLPITLESDELREIPF